MHLRTFRTSKPQWFWKFKYLNVIMEIKTYFGLKRPLKGSLALSLALPLLLDFDDTFSRCLTVIFAYNPVLLYFVYNHLTDR